MAESDTATLTPVFRACSPPQANLARARECLSIHAATPSAVAAALKLSRAALLASVSRAGADSLLETGSDGYFVPVIRPMRTLLDQNILGIPASAFGSSRDDITILSSLTFAR